MARKMGDSGAWEATDQIGPVLGSDFVASFEHLGREQE